MNTLIKKVDGGIAKDDFGKLQLKIPAGVLAADTTVTIVTSVLAHVVTAPYVLIAAWRIDTNVALASLATLPGTLCYMVPTTIPEGKLRFYVDNQTPAASPLAPMPDGWTPLPDRGLPADGMVHGDITRLPPANMKPSYIALVQSP